MTRARLLSSLLASVLGLCIVAGCNTLAELEADLGGDDGGDTPPSDVPDVVATCDEAQCAGTCCELEGGSGCFLLDGDEAHCGTCGTACEAHQLCVEGSCTAPAFATVAVGGQHSCATLEPEREVWCWGANGAGEVDPTSDEPRHAVARAVSFPPLAPDAGQPVRATALAAGGRHSCALTEAGELWCWGDNGKGQLGVLQGALPGNETHQGPERVLGGAAVSYRAVAAGEAHTCAITTTDELLCWGSNSAGQLGRMVTLGDSSATPLPVDEPAGPWMAVSAGAMHTCAVHDSGEVYCWGDDEFGQLGYGAIGNTGPLVADVAGASLVAAGARHSCAANDSMLWCWGDDNQGQLGSSGANTSGSFAEPVVLEGSGAVQSIAAGGTFGCMRRSADAGTALWCWGENTLGQLGLGASEDALVEAPRQLLETGVAVVAAGDVHACAVVGAARTLRCWGGNAQGQLGLGTSDEDPHPSPQSIVLPEALRER